MSSFHRNPVSANTSCGIVPYQNDPGRAADLLNGARRSDPGLPPVAAAAEALLAVARCLWARASPKRYWGQNVLPDDLLSSNRLNRTSRTEPIWKLMQECDDTLLIVRHRVSFG